MVNKETTPKTNTLSEMSRMEMHLNAPKTHVSSEPNRLLHSIVLVGYE